MTPQTTFVNGINPWKTHPEHRPRPWAVAPEPEPAPVVVVVVKKGRPPIGARRNEVLEQIRKAGSASGRELMEFFGWSKHLIDGALLGLRKDGRVLIKRVPIANRKPSYLYFPKDTNAQS